MEDVSDPPFRAVCKDHGADMMYTEFISSEGLIRDAVKSVRKLDIFEYERPIGIQLYGSEIESMREAAEIADEAAEAAGRIPERCQSADHPALGAVGSQEAMVEGAGAPFGSRRIPDGADVVAILRVDRTEPAVAERLLGT